MESEGKNSGVGPKAVNVGSSDSSVRQTSLHDAEKAEHGVGETVQLKRRLQSRHLQMIAIGECQHSVQQRSLLTALLAALSALVCSSAVAALSLLLVQLERSSHTHSLALSSIA